MTNFRQIIFTIFSVCLIFSTSLSFAESKDNRENSENTNKTQLDNNKEMNGYNKYLELIRKQNEDRQCANLPPQHVYNFKEYKQAYNY